MDYQPTIVSRCGNKPNRFLQDMTCNSPDPYIRSVMDVWEYRNSHRGSLDQIPYYDQNDSFADRWYTQGRVPDYDIMIDEPKLSTEAELALSRALGVLGDYSLAPSTTNESVDQWSDVIKQLKAIPDSRLSDDRDDIDWFIVLCGKKDAKEFRKSYTQYPAGAVKDRILAAVVLGSKDLDFTEDLTGEKVSKDAAVYKTAIRESNDKFVDLGNSLWSRLKPIMGADFFLDDVDSETDTIVIGSRSKDSVIEDPDKFMHFVRVNDLRQSGWEIRNGKMFMNLQVKQ